MGESEAGFSKYLLHEFLYELHGQDTSPKLRKTEVKMPVMEGGAQGKQGQQSVYGG